MKNLKILICVIISISMILSLSVTAFATSSTQFNTLLSEFKVARAGNGMKYASYEPQIQEDVKYPLVVYVHGLGHGWSDTSFKNSGLTYWAGDEMQSKFLEGGAYLLMPKIPEAVITATQTEKVFNVIEEYVNAHADTIDTNQIYIIGGSAGGALTWRILSAHPGYFHKAVVLCGIKTLTLNDAQTISDTPVWMISAKTDPLVWYFLFSSPNWSRLIRNSNVKEQCRHSVFSGSVQLPDGTHPGLSHLLAKTIGYNLCRLSDEQPLNGMTTKDGNGNTVNISFDNSIIEWFQNDIIQKEG